MDYRLLYWTPDPESGERIIIALLFTDENHMALMFDTDFKKVSRVWPTHSQIVKVILDDIAHALAMATEDTVENAVERVLRDYAPQITASAKRSCAVEIDETVISHLLEKHVFAEKQPTEKPVYYPKNTAIM